MFTRWVAGVAVGAAMLGAAGPADAAKAAKKKKAEPLDTAALYKKVDADSDGKVTLDEFKKLFTFQAAPKGKKGAPAVEPDLETVFKSLDANGDKTLSAEEFKGVIGAVYPPPKK